MPSPFAGRGGATGGKGSVLDALTLSELLRLLANLSAHLAAWREDITTLIPDSNARTIINLDWEKWHASHPPPPTRRPAWF